MRGIIVTDATPGIFDLTPPGPPIGLCLALAVDPSNRVPIRLAWDYLDLTIRISSC